MGYEEIASQSIHCESGQSEAKFIFSGAEIDETGAFTLTCAKFTNPAFSRQEKTELIPAIRDLHVLFLPAALTTIESEAFTHLGNIDAVRVPHSVRIIADDAFDQGILLIVPAGSYAETWAEGREDIYSFNQTE